MDDQPIEGFFDANNQELLFRNFNMQQSLQLLLSIINKSTDYIFIKDVEGKYLFVNQKMADFFSLPAAEIIGKTDFDLMMPNEAKIINKNDINVLAGEPMEEDLQRKVKGNLLILHLKKYPFYNGNDKINGLIGIAKDITVFRISERILAESESYYRALIENLPDAVLVHTDYVIKFLNPAAMAILKIEEIENVIDTSVFQFVQKLNITETSGKISGLLKNQIPENYEIKQVERADGEKIFVELKAIPVNYKNKSSVLLIFRDITARLAAENKIKLSEQRYKLLAENILDVIWTINLDGEFTYVSPSVLQLRGIDVDKARTQKFSEAFCADSCEVILDLIKKIKNNKSNEIITATCELEQPCRDNTTVWTEAVIKQVVDENNLTVGIVGVSRNINERKKAQQVIRRQEANYRLLFDNAVNTILVGNEKGQIIDANIAVTELTGYSLSDLFGKKINFLFTKETLEAVPFRYDLLEKGLMVRNERLLLRKDGQMLWVEMNTKKLLDGRYLTFLINIHSRKMAEEEIQFNEKRLQILLNLYQMNNASIKEICDYALGELITITKSKIGYIGFVNETETVLKMYAWSKSAMHECNVKNKDLEYDLEKTGLWGEAIRQRRAIITNDYNAPNIYKKGIPKGHVHLVRHLSAPIFENDKIVLVVGVGNKDAEYNENDVNQIVLLMTGMWKIVQLHKAQEDLLQSAGIFENMMEGIYIYQLEDVNDDLSLRLVAANPAVENLTGLAPSQIIGKTIDENFPNLKNQNIPKIYADVVRTQVPVHIDDILYSDSRILESVYSVRAFPLPKNKVGVIFDNITEKKFAELELQKSEQRFRMYFQLPIVGIVIVAPDGHWIEVNDKFCDIIGYSREEIFNFTWLDITPSEHLLLELKLYKQVISGQKTPNIIEKKYKHKNGYFIDVEVSAMCVFNSENQPDYLIAIVQDISERKFNETERERLINQLELKNAELENFTYTVSHDLRSPIVTIKGFIGLLNSDIANNDSEAIKEDIQRINDAAEKMKLLLNNLLDLSRVGRIINEPELVEMNEIIKDALNITAGILNEHKVKINVEYNFPKVFVDKQRLVEVCQNLIENAVKFNNAEEPLIEFGFLIKKNANIFFVRDNGIGIDPKYHENIFGLFNKLDAQTPGTGLGLALCRKIIEVHHGKIWVESDGLNKGTTFYFTLNYD